MAYIRGLMFSPSDRNLPIAVQNALDARHFSLTKTSHEPELVHAIESKAVDLAIIESDLEIAKAVRQADRYCPILLLVSQINAQMLLAAIRAGVSDVVLTSSFDELIDALDRIIPPVPDEDTSIRGPRLVGSSAAMRQVRMNLIRAAASSSNVLITGETGTGKELAAEVIHRNSSRSAHPFVSVNCAALPDSLFESELFGHERGAFTGAQSARSGKLQFANGGTFFMDEIGDMNMCAQSKILRAIETRRVQRLGGNQEIPVDIRVIAATNRNLEEMVAQRLFREDLYYRLNIARIHLPPLRERRADIPALLEHVAEDLNRRSAAPPRELSRDLTERLGKYDWPGNIRELRNALESAFVFGPSRIIRYGDLPEQLRAKLDPVPEAVPDPEEERNRVLHALDSTEWNRSEAAKVLRWSRMTLYRKMHKYQIRRGPARVECNTTQTAVTA